MTLKTRYPVNQGYAARTALLSRTIFRICLLRGSSASSSEIMDRYFRIDSQKKDYEFTKLGRAVCVLGRTGIGKSWAVHDAYDPCIEITPDILKSKNDTIEFLTKIRGTKIPVILDEYECVQGLIGLKEITSVPTEGPFIIISQVPVKFDFDVAIYEFPVPTRECMKRIVPDATDAVLDESKGDLRAVIQASTFRSDIRDDFRGPREFVGSLVSRDSNIRPIDFIGAPIAEPGNMVSILNANYLDYPSVNYEKVSEYFSRADLIDVIVYSGDWEFMPYFNLWGCILPAIEIGHTLGPVLKPGSTWTKYQNMCMRRKKIKAMYERVPRAHQDLDGILLIMDYIEKDEKKAIELMIEYGFKKEDVDMFNHVSPFRKLKAKMVGHLKKSITPP